MGASIAVVAQRTDHERYSTAAAATRRSSRRRPRSRTGRPAWPGSRPACRCWPRRSAPRCCTRRSTPARCGPACPVTVTVHDATFFTEPEHYDKSRRTFFRSAIKTSLRRAARVIVPSKATRDELIRLLDADPTRIDVAYHGVDPAAFHAPDRRREGPGAGPARPRRLALRRVPRRQGAAQERAEPDPRLGGRRAGHGQAAGAGGRRRLRATTTRSTRPWPRCRRTCGCCARATCASPTCPATSAARWSRPTRPTARASVCRSWRRWRAALRCSPPRGCRCRRSVATRWPTPGRARRRSPATLARLLDDEPRRLALARAGAGPRPGVHLGVQRRGAPRGLGPRGRGLTSSTERAADLRRRVSNATPARRAAGSVGMMSGCSTR